jgi:transposase
MCFLLSAFRDKPVVGIDVASDSSMVAVLAPDGSQVMKPFKVPHTPKGFDRLLTVLKKQEERFDSRPILAMESTGIYHLPLFLFLKSNDFQGFVLNPLSVHSTRNFEIRKVKNDPKDALSIARLAKYQPVKFSSMPEPGVFILRSLVRDRAALSDEFAGVQKKLQADLHLSFPGFATVFSHLSGKAAMAVLRRYPSPALILEADTSELAKWIARIGHNGFDWGYEKVRLLREAAAMSLAMPSGFSGLQSKFVFHLDRMRDLEASMAQLDQMIKDQIDSPVMPGFIRRNIRLLESIPGISRITAIALAAEIGDVSRFSSPKQLVAFLGLDPSVKQSGKFTGSRNKMSKRGSAVARRFLFIAAMCAAKKPLSDDSKSRVLYAFYCAKRETKPRKVAMVALMHKLTLYIFAVLRDQKEYEVRKPSEHDAWRIKKLRLHTVQDNLCSNSKAS